MPISAPSAPRPATLGEPNGAGTMGKRKSGLSEAQLAQRRAAAAARTNLGGRPRTVDSAWRNAMRRAAQLVREAAMSGQLAKLSLAELVLKMDELARKIEAEAAPEER